MQNFNKTYQRFLLHLFKEHCQGSSDFTNFVPISFISVTPLTTRTPKIIKYNAFICPKDADEMGDSVDLDQTAPVGAV